MKERGVKAIVSIDPDRMEGVYANSFKMRANGEETRIDFLYLDDDTLDEETREIHGKVVARVNMSGVNFRDLAKVIEDVCAREYGNSGDGE